MARHHGMCFTYSVLIILIISQWTKSFKMDTLSPGEQSKEYCEFEDFIAHCNLGESIIMEQAFFGRMRLGRCITEGYGHLGCSNNVLQKLDKLCTGKEHCSLLKLGRVDFPQATSCGEFFQYLEASYTCASVLQESALQTLCSAPDHTFVLYSSEITVLNELIQGLSCFQQAPYINFKIKVSLGQHISITLLDFEIDTSSPLPICVNFGKVIESYTGQETELCGGKTRRTIAFESNSNLVEIRLEKGNKHRFALEFKTLGCPDLQAPAHGWIKREKHKVSMGCYSPLQTWHLTCRNNHWTGVVGNCSSVGGIQQMESNQNKSSAPDISQGVLLALIVAGAITLSIAAVTLAVVCWKRKTVGLEAAKLKAHQQQMLKAPLSDSDYMHPSQRPTSTLDETEDAVYDFCFAPNTPAPVPNHLAVTLPCRGNTFHYNNTVTRAPDSPKYKTLIFVNQ